MDRAEQAQWTLRLKIELEHYDLIEKRNAALVLETAFPIALLTLAYEVKILDFGNLPYFVITAAVSFYCIHILFVERYDAELKRLRKELESIVLTLQKVQAKKERARPKKTVLHLIIMGGEAMMFASLFLPNFVIFATGLAIASAGFLTVIYRQRFTLGVSLKKLRERLSIAYPF